MFTHEQAQNSLNNATNRNIRIIEWGGSTRKTSLFLDVDREVQFSATLRYVVQGFYQNPNRYFSASKSERSLITSLSKIGKPRISKKEKKPPKPKKIRNRNLTAEKALVTLSKVSSHRQFEILEWGGNAESISKFKCLLHNYEFTCSFSYLRDKIQQLPDIMLGVGLNNPVVKQTRRKTRISKGQNYPLYKGLSVSEWAEKIGSSYSFAQTAFKNKSYVDLDSYSSTLTSIEYLVQEILRNYGVSFTVNKMLKGCSYRPDFIIQDHKLIIECDGVYWHSDANQPDKSYHLKKLQAYEAQDYRALFFRENELRDKLPIVQAIVASRLGLAPKYMARKLAHGQGDSSFFETNHLMGKGSGRVYTLTLDGEAKVAMQVKWKDKNAGLLEISRFCTDGCSVAGGFSRLLNKIIEEEKPRQVMTFIDKRYGTGHYLPNLGFKHCGEHLSFSWTTRTDVVHRMKFPGNTGYGHGYHKLWDCGQAKWILDIA